MGGAPPPDPERADTPPVPPRRLTPMEEAMVITGSMLAQKRLDFEKGMSYAPPLTVILIVVLIAVFIWQLAAGTLETRESIIAAGALVRENVLAGEVWRTLSAAFLHGSPDHLVGNLISLYILGMACEHALGAGGLAIVYFASALGGSALSLAMSPGPGVGASGAIFGLMGAIVLILHRLRDKVFVRDKRIGVVIAVWAGYTLFIGALSPVVDNGAHLGGLIAGAMIAGLVPVRLSLPT